MSNSDNTQLIKVAKWFMLITGLYKGVDAKNAMINNIYNAIYSKFTIGFYFLFLLLLSKRFIELIVLDEDFHTILSSFAVIISVSRILIKIVIFLKNNIDDVLDEIIEKEEKIWQSNDDDVLQVYKDKIKLCRIFGASQFANSFATIALFAVIGIRTFKNVHDYNKVNNTTLNSNAWFQIWLPFNKVEHLPFTYSLEILFTCESIAFNTAVNVLLITLLMGSAVHLEALHVKLRKFVKVNPENEIDQASTIASLKTLIMEHQSHIRFVEHMNECIKYIVLLEFMLSSMDVASTSLVILKFELLETSTVMFNLVYIILMLWQIFAFSWTCNEIMVQSVNIAGSLYKSQWHLLNKEGRLLVQVMMIRAQRPLEITIGPFGAMTLESGLMILKGAYSYISLMN